MAIVNASNQYVARLKADAMLYVNYNSKQIKDVRVLKPDYLRFSRSVQKNHQETA